MTKSLYGDFLIPFQESQLYDPNIDQWGERCMRVKTTNANRWKSESEEGLSVTLYFPEHSKTAACKNMSSEPSSWETYQPKWQETPQGILTCA